MSPSEAFCLPSIASLPPNAAGVVPAPELEGVEAALMAARDRILKELDRELAAIRVLRTRTRQASAPAMLAVADPWNDAVPDLSQCPPLPGNVVPVAREVFAPQPELPVEAALDPELERATIEELNAALAAAFNQMATP